MWKFGVRTVNWKWNIFWKTSICPYHSPRLLKKKTDLTFLTTVIKQNLQKPAFQNFKHPPLSNFFLFDYFQIFLFQNMRKNMEIIILKKFPKMFVKVQFKKKLPPPLAIYGINTKFWNAFRHCACVYCDAKSETFEVGGWYGENNFFKFCFLIFGFKMRTVRFCRSFLLVISK